MVLPSGLQEEVWWNCGSIANWEVSRQGAGKGNFSTTYLCSEWGREETNNVWGYGYADE